MQPITDPIAIERCRDLLRRMMENQSTRTYDFDVGWVRSRGWKVVPVEDTGHFAPVEIAVIVPALREVGYMECFAIASEPTDPAPSCYRVPVTEEGLHDFNSECGYLRYVLTDENRSWAISCNEWYNLFAAKPDLLERLLGAPIDQARQEFAQFASMLARGNPDEPLVRVAERYAAV